MTKEFMPQFGIALLADYYHVTYLLNSDRAQGLNICIPGPMWSHFGNFFDELEIDFTMERVKENPENYAWIKFASEKEKNKADDYFEAFNFHNRKNEMIALPNLYEGKSTPNSDICVWYLDAIISFFNEDFESKIAIPFGISEDDPNERMFMVYSNTGMVGLYKGTQLFKNSPIRFVNK